MKALIVIESCFVSTETVTQAVATGLRSPGSTWTSPTPLTPPVPQMRTCSRSVPPRTTSGFQSYHPDSRRRTKAAILRPQASPNDSPCCHG